MKKLYFPTLVLFAFSILMSCKPTNNNNMKQPKAKKIAKELVMHGHTRIDNYYWLNNNENPEVINYLNDENFYKKEIMKNTNKLQGEIYDEIIGRIKQTDETVPYNYNGFSYYVKFEEGLEYPIYCRKNLDKISTEEIFLDCNKMAQGHPFFQVGGWEFSTNNKLLAYSIDTISRRKYDIYFRNIVSNKLFDEIISNTTGNMVWANNNRTVYYQVKDETLRSYRIYKHEVGTAVETDVLIFEEADPTFSVYVYKTKSNKYLVISSESTLSSECRILDANNPDGEFCIFQKRLPKVEYSIRHQNGRFLILTNYEASNFCLMEVGENDTDIGNWTEVIEGRDDVMLEDLNVFADFFVVTERKNGLPKFRVFNTNLVSDYYLNFEEDDYYVISSANPDFSSRKFRYNYSSLKTPRTVYDYDMIDREQKMLKRQEVLGGYNPDDYITDRKYAVARDGVKVPISIVYKKGYKIDGKAPLLLYAYGSYGISIESTFRSSRLSLLDRGFAYAIAHIRGGEELGRHWYEDGKMLNKKNTYFDFIDCGKYLVAEKYTSPDKMFAMGGSAGGLLVGAVINYNPELFKGVIAAVPFVDIVTTMLDESIPLTTGEYDEWGNPNDKVYYDYMLSYSPYDQVEAKEYPALLVTTGLHDSQVQYWEPAKWVAKLREMKTDDNILLLKTNMDFGHGGASGRFEQYKETALEYAFMLMLLNPEKY
ncbi:MAG: S9 family peptidase [Bacteroidetes bacterium]|nr:S9 family peptidase [Bacteroidota bacterium]